MSRTELVIISSNEQLKEVFILITRLAEQDGSESSNIWLKLIGQGVVVAMVDFGRTSTLLMCWSQQIRHGEWWWRHNLWILVRGWWRWQPWCSYCIVCWRLESVNKVVVVVIQEGWRPSYFTYKVPPTHFCPPIILPMSLGTFDWNFCPPQKFLISSWVLGTQDCLPRGPLWVGWVPKFGVTTRAS